MRFLFVALFACGSFVHAQPAPSAVSGNGEPYSGPVIDLHAHVFFDERVAASVNPDMLATPDRFLEDVADPRLVKAAALVIAPGGEQETRELNDQLREFVSRSDGALLAVGSVHPDDGEQALKELQRLAETGFAMVKLHPNTQSFAVGSAAVREVVCKAGDLGLPVMFDFSGALQSSEVGDYVTLAIQCPQTQLVLAHMGMARFDETLVVATLAKYPWYGRNIWMDMSVTASTYAGSPYREQFVWVLRQIGMDRILFGSDYPFYTTSAAIADVERLGLTDIELHQVFFDNARALLGLEDGNLSHSSAAGHESGARATYLANEGLMVAHGETKVLFDPLFNERFGQYRLVPESMRRALLAGDPPWDGVDAVFISHYHDDHFSPRDMLEFLRVREDVHLYAPEQAIAALREAAGAEDEGLSGKLHAIALEHGDEPQQIAIPGLLIEAVRIPHSGWPTRATGVENIAWRVTLNDRTTVLHLGDADTKDLHFEQHGEHWAKRRPHMVFPPYWYFLSQGGLEVLRERLRPVHAVGIHVPVTVPENAAGREEALQDADLFIRPGETRAIPQR